MKGEKLVKNIFVQMLLFLFIVLMPVYVWAQPELEKMKTDSRKRQAEIQEKIETADEKAEKSSKKEPAAGRWVKRNQKYFYYENGKKVTGLKEIDGRYYYFDAKGVQRTGWQKYQSDYYFFQIKNRRQGYMLRSQRVNGIALGRKGRAKAASSDQAKLDVLLKASRIVDEVVQPGMKKSEKLRMLFDYSIAHFLYRGSPVFQLTDHWELTYALQMFDEGHGSCYAYGAAFAFLADAAGCRDCYAISSGGHGWAEADGKIYDLAWHQIDKNHSYYGVSYDLSGIAGRPNYRRARIYVVKI